jgi:hypothetical protein
VGYFTLIEKKKQIPMMSLINFKWQEAMDFSFEQTLSLLLYDTLWFTISKLLEKKIAFSS